LTSVLNELGGDYEIIVRDNESSDNTVDVLNEFGARVKVMKCTRSLEGTWPPQRAGATTSFSTTLTPTPTGSFSQLPVNGH